MVSLLAPAESGSMVYRSVEIIRSINAQHTVSMFIVFVFALRVAGEVYFFLTSSARKL